MTTNDAREKLEKYKYILQGLAAITLGVALIYAAARFKQHETTHDVLNEFGIAIVIAAVVTLMYETYARKALASESMTKVFEVIMKDVFDNRLWTEMREQLLEKAAIRRAFSVRISLEEDSRLGANRAVLWVAVTYRVDALRSKTEKVKIYHYLDHFMRDSNTKFPRFTDISVGSDVIDPRQISDEFERDVFLKDWPGGVPIIVERREIVYVPGSYNLIMSDLTEVEMIRVESLLDDVDVDIYWTLQKPLRIKAFNACRINRMFLPGHAIEFRFNRRTASAAAHGPKGAA
jgi:hypothetical protein